jgi:hypothetical protein
MSTSLEAVRAEALFASCLQASQCPTSGAVRDAVAVTLRSRGVRGCAAAVAEEFGSHPETAVPRMTWALQTVRSTYPTRRQEPVRLARLTRTRVAA